MASGWNLWVWLECIGVVSACCCKEVYRYPQVIIIINFPHSTCISSFFGSSIPTSFFIFYTILTVLFHNPKMDVSIPSHELHIHGQNAQLAMWPCFIDRDG